MSSQSSMSAMSDSEVEELLLLATMLKKKRQVWVHEINEKRKNLGENKLCIELESHEDRFYTYFRMNVETFEYLHQLLEPHIKKKDTNYRNAISTKERLALCLRFLATGDTYTTISFSYRLGGCTVSKIVTEVCEQMWKILQPEYIPTPSMKSWLEIADAFQTIWGFPNCLGSIDGKHVVIKCPPNSGSLFYCYKKRFSTVLLAIVDPHYKFTYIDVGSYGKDSDSTIFENSSFYQLLKSGQDLSLPAPKPLPGFEEPTPHVFIADGGFKLETFLMRPFTREAVINDDDKKKFNRSLSSARVVVECAFGILAQKFRIFLRPFETNLNNTIKIVKAAVCLHNMLQVKEGAHTFDSKNFSETVGALAPMHLNRHRADSAAFNVRNQYVKYFKEN